MSIPKGEMPGAALIVNYELGTRHGVGGRRWALLGRAMLEAGHEVHFLTTREDVPEELNAWGRYIHHFRSAYPSAIRKTPRTIFDKLAYRFTLALMRFRIPGTLFDLGKCDKAILLEHCRKLIRQHQIRVCIFTGAPFSYLYFGTLLKNEFPELILVSDFRDKWTEGINYGMRNLSPKRLNYEKACELAVIRQSDLVTVASEDLSDYLKKIHQRDYLLLYNAISPALQKPDTATIAHARDPQSFQFMHVGNISEGCETQTEHFLHTLKELIQLQPGKFSLMMVGCSNQNVVDRFNNAGIQGISFVERLPQKELGSLMNQADAFLVFNRESLPQSIPTKFLDYITFHKPIIAYRLSGKLATLISGEKLGVLLDDSKSFSDSAKTLAQLANGNIPFNSMYDCNDFNPAQQIEVLKTAINRKHQAS